MGKRAVNPQHASKSKIFCNSVGQTNLETVPLCSSQGSHVNGDTSGNLSGLLGKHPVSQEVGVNLSREIGAAGEEEMASEEWSVDCGLWTVEPDRQG